MPACHGAWYADVRYRRLRVFVNLGTARIGVRNINAGVLRYLCRKIPIDGKVKMGEKFRWTGRLEVTKNTDGCKG